jgi:lysophospholipase L1-like esterase
MQLSNKPSHEGRRRSPACILAMRRTMTTTLELVVATTAITLVISAAAAALSPTAAGRPVGVSADPCARVPIEPAPAHEAAANPYESWMSEWLALDWGQQCRYRRENAALSPPSRSRVVFLGDSITEGWKSLDPDFFVPDILDRGISGQTTAQMLVRFRADVLDLRPQVVHIMAGTNDIAGNTGATSLAIIQGNMMSMVEQARCHGITVILASIPPAAQFAWRQDIQPAATIAAMNAWLRSYAKRELLLGALGRPRRAQIISIRRRSAPECRRLCGDASPRPSCARTGTFVRTSRQFALNASEKSGKTIGRG